MIVLSPKWKEGKKKHNIAYVICVVCIYLFTFVLYDFTQCVKSKSVFLGDL